MKNHTNTRLHPRQFGLRASDFGLRNSRAFTLVELLVVIAIISILAALLLPVLSRVKIKAQVQKAHMETGTIANAIHTYEADYSKFPVSSVGAVTATSEAARLNEDFTYGTFGVTCVGPGGLITPISSGFATPKPGTYQTIIAPGNYQTNNAEVMSALMDVEYWPTTPSPTATMNVGHVKNPQRTGYLNATMSGNVTGPGIGLDGTYRDLWGNPYIITVDLNYDDKARDAFYRNLTVSGGPNNQGLNGLIEKVDSNGNPVLINGVAVFEANSPVMVWSAGPDKMIDPTQKANLGANKDNVISWQ